MAFYFDVPLDEALRRIEAGREAVKYYEAGMDLGLSDNPFESFRLFQEMIQNEYNKMVDDFGLYRIDAAESLVQQQRRMRRAVEPHLTGLTRVDDGDLAGALAEFGLSGRYMPELSGR